MNNIQGALSAFIPYIPVRVQSVTGNYYMSVLSFLPSWLLAYKVGLFNCSTTDTLSCIILILEEAFLCLVGCLAASLASAHSMPVIPTPIPTCDNQKCLQILPRAPGRMGPNCPLLSITVLNKTL